MQKAYRTLNYNKTVGRGRFRGHSQLLKEYKDRVVLKRGHDSKLDQANGNKIVNNDPTRFFGKRNSFIPEGTSKIDNKLLVK